MVAKFPLQRTRLRATSNNHTRWKHNRGCIFEELKDWSIKRKGVRQERLRDLFDVACETLCEAQSKDWKNAQKKRGYTFVETTTWPRTGSRKWTRGSKLKKDRDITFFCNGSE